MASAGNAVPFDGETQGNGAEVAGGQQVTLPLGPEVRTAVDQVLNFENARLGVARATEAVGDFFGVMWNGLMLDANAQAGQRPAQRHIPARPLPVIARPPPPAQQEERPAGMFAGMFNAVRSFVSDVNNPPTHAIRTTQQRRPQQIVRRVPIRVDGLGLAQNVPRSTLRLTSYGQQNENNPRVTRSRTVRAATESREVIDLTGDD